MKTTAYFEARRDPAFVERLTQLLRHYVGRPTPLHEATRAAGAYREALAIIEPLAHDSNDDRLLRPWAAALERLGRIDDQRTVTRRLEAMGYRTPVTAVSTGGSGLRQPAAVK